MVEEERLRNYTKDEASIISYALKSLCLVMSGREELLTEHAIHWDRQKIEGLPCPLAKRSTEGQDQLKKLQEEMKDLLQNLGLKQSEVSIKRWKDDVLRVARGL